MPTSSAGPLVGFAQRFSDYLPTLAAGLFVLALGIGVGWLVKRGIVWTLVWLRLDRLGGRAGWRAAFGKGDVRASLYNLGGAIGMVLVVLTFLDNALQIWGLTVLSQMIDWLVFYLPNLGLVGLIVGGGILLSSLAAARTEAALDEEGFEHARLVGKVLKAVLLSVVTALALWQLGFARQIVLSAFLIAFGSVGVSFALAVGLGSARAIQKAWEGLFERKEE
jgi:hypothetical protein